MYYATNIRYVNRHRCRRAKKRIERYSKLNQIIGARAQYTTRTRAPMHARASKKMRQRARVGEWYFVYSLHPEEASPRGARGSTLLISVERSTLWVTMHRHTCCVLVCRCSKTVRCGLSVTDRARASRNDAFTHDVCKSVKYTSEFAPTYARDGTGMHNNQNEYLYTCAKKERVRAR